MIFLVKDNWTALLCAAKEGHTAVCLELLDHGANIEHRDVVSLHRLMYILCDYN